MVRQSDCFSYSLSLSLSYRFRRYAEERKCLFSLCFFSIKKNFLLRVRLAIVKHFFLNIACVEREKKRKNSLYSSSSCQFKSIWTKEKRFLLGFLTIIDRCVIIKIFSRFFNLWDWNLVFLFKFFLKEQQDKHVGLFCSWINCGAKSRSVIRNDDSTRLT